MCYKFNLRGLLLLLLLPVPAAQGFNGAVWRVPLQEQTQLVLEVVPNLGTRLIFPFLLDSPQLRPPLNYKLTNTQSFTVTRNLELLAGQNVFLITAQGPTAAVGKLYLSIGGYNLALNLVVSHELDDHVSDIYFMLSEDDRNLLLEQAINRIREGLQQDYEQRLAQLQRHYDKEALAVAINYPANKRNIKKLYRGSKESFATADIYLDRFIYAEQYFYALSFEVQHYSNKFTLRSLVIQTTTKDGSSQLLEGELSCFPRTIKLDECVFVTQDADLVARQKNLLLTLTNDKDEIFTIDY